MSKASAEFLPNGSSGTVEGVAVSNRLVPHQAQQRLLKLLENHQCGGLQTNAPAMPAGDAAFRSSNGAAVTFEYYLDDLVGHRARSRFNVLSYQFSRSEHRSYRDVDSFSQASTIVRACCSFCSIS